MRSDREPGAPVRAGHVPLSVPHLVGNEARYLQECISTNYVSSVGPFVGRFEHMLAAAIGGGHAVATASGTAALHVALLVAGVEPGDEVLISTLTFIAPANAIRYAGAHPVFIDAEPDYWQMDPLAVERYLTAECEVRGGILRNRTTGRRVRAILPVHILGHPVDFDPIVALARRFGLAVIEDATESLGAAYCGRWVGCLGDVAAFSFNGNKLITTGGGGMLVTGREDWAQRARYLTTQAKDDATEFVHGAVGFNYRLTNLQAAVGVAQLEQLDAFLAAKRRIAERYQAELADVPGISAMPAAPWAQPAWWLYTVRIDAARYGADRRETMRRLDTCGIQTRPLWQPMHRSPAHADATRPCPTADLLQAQCLSLPCSVGLTDMEQTRVIAALRARRAH